MEMKNKNFDYNWECVYCDEPNIVYIKMTVFIIVTVCSAFIYKIYI